MKIEPTVNESNRQATIKIAGELDVHQSKMLKAAAFDVFRDGPWTYIFDMAQVTYLDSSGLGMLVFLQKEIVKRGGELQIINLKDTVYKVFELTKLTNFFKLSVAATPGHAP